MTYGDLDHYGTCGSVIWVANTPALSGSMVTRFVRWQESTGRSECAMQQTNDDDRGGNDSVGLRDGH
jgi:hypothetical protein